MTVFIKDIPTLTGKSADRFIKMYEKNIENRASIDFSKEAANSRAILAKRNK